MTGRNEGMSLEAFSADETLRRAFVRSLEIMPPSVVAGTRTATGPLPCDTLKPYSTNYSTMLDTELRVA